ncbi:MAG: ATP-dependent DNA helicase [Thermoplasmatales archaeon]|nr:ATP-dependent DNA helicase [Thermoplasmatales archaeon]
MDLFPYDLRKNQENIMRDIRNTLDARKHFVFESGTGSGKTICALSSTLQYALENNKKIVYTTRTNAQQRQVILELRAIRKKMKDKRIFGLGMQGRANMCILAKNDPEIGNGSSEELSKFCSNQKKKALSNKKNEGCEYYRNFIGDKQKIDKILEWARQKLPTAEEFVEYCKKNTVCPYEMNKLLIKEAIVIVVPYIYVFDKSIRIMLFDWLSISEDDILLVVDEAHNLPDYLRDLFSAQLSAWMLNSCVFEAEKVGDPSIANGKISVSKFCKILLEIVNDLRDTYVYGILENGIRRNTHVKSDAFIPSHELESEILSRLKITSITLRDIISDLIAYGEKIQDYRQKEGKLPRSYIHKLGIFLEFWITVEMDRYIKLVVDSAEGKNPRIEAYCLDPSIGTGIINEFHSSIHMSGTLKPLEEYRDSLGLSQYTELVFYPSPFSRENRRIFFTRDVTTRYEEIARDKTIISRMWQHITNICNTFPKNTMVFFPSFNVLSMFRNKGYFTDIERCLYVEEQAMSQSDLMDLVIDFKRCGVENSNGAALFSVIGGRISEGMDFPAEQLEIAVIVGIPYPKPTARQRGLQRYYDLKFGKGWEYTVNAPAARKLLQSIGRLIRDENDRGVAVVLDKRAPRFKQYISDMRESKNLLADISSFMNR